MDFDSQQRTSAGKTTVLEWMPKPGSKVLKSSVSNDGGFPGLEITAWAKRLLGGTPDAPQQPSFVPYPGNDKVRIGDIQRRAILGKFHFQYVFPPRFPTEFPEKFKDVMTSNLCVSNSSARSLVNDVFAVPDGPICSKQRIIAAAILRV